MQKSPHLRIHIQLDNPHLSLTVEQIVEAIKSQIQIDQVAPGCRLPPVRVLAHQLGISKTTVQKAYDELVAQSLVESVPRVGLFVSEGQKSFDVATDVSVPAPLLSVLEGTLPVLSSGRRTDEPIPLSSVFIDPDLLPRERIATCFRAVMKQPGLLHMYNERGYPPLRKKIAERLQKRGIQARAEDVVITAGSQQALDLVCRILKNKTVGIENPAYGIGKDLFEMNGLRAVGLPIDPFEGIDSDLWERTIAQKKPGLVALTTNFHNPIGYSYTTHELNHILSWSQQYNFGILEDDWGSDMLSFSEFRPSLRARGGSSVFYINSFTKKLLPSLRLGYIVGNEETVPALLASKRVACLGLPTLVEAALFEFLDRGYYDAHLKQLQAELDDRYRNCLNLLRSLMPEGVRWTTPGGGPCVWVELPKQIDVHDLLARVRQRGVSIRSMDRSFFGRPHLNGFRIGYALLTPECLQQGLEILARELRKMVVR